ncbi:MAG: glycosyltransferase family 2 protein [Gammaproteobacteria bacterium]|nr:MAG: glycosyltransferase family 2 protein [Gammaproteobacteria bacterium]
MSPTTGQNNHSTRMGEVLIKHKLIKESQLEQALELQKRTGARIGDILLAKGWVDPLDFYPLLASQAGHETIVAPAGEHEARFGEVLEAYGLLSAEQLQEALELQEKWGTRLGDIILAKGWVRTLDFYRAMASHSGHRFINLTVDPPDAALIDREDLQLYGEYLILPWRREGKDVWVVTADLTPPTEEFIRERFGDGVKIAITSKFDIIWELQRNANPYYSQTAVSALAVKSSEYSALQVFTRRQLGVIYCFFSALLLFLTLEPVIALITINTFIAIFLLVNFGLRAMLAWVGGDRHIDVKVTDHQVSVLKEQELPTYTVLVPMYKEPEVLPILADALRRLDYPLSKLDIKLILEEDDAETIQAAKELELEGIFELILVPDSLPKTKPKACNYALNFARGEFITIYDAEDIPEPDQLKKVVAAFQMAPRNTVCIQARLNYYNARENWLTRMFTLEYSLWFDFYLPALEALNIPIPLGGTSNHFKMHILREVNAWDPFNVTEDADLGVRITQLGYRVGIVNSTTFEEANSNVLNWIRQRSRWIKGYMQTYLVHMRHPLHLHRSVGAIGFWGFQFFIGGTIISTLAAPFLYLMYIIWLMTKTHIFDIVFPPSLLYISLFNLLVGNGYLIYITTLGAFKRNYYSMIPYGLTVPVYWLLISIAAYKGLWQLIHKPFFWEKTQHGISRYTPLARRRALRRNA